MINILGNLLFNRAYTKETFIDAVLERETDFPTGLQLELFGAAIPHASSTHVKQTGICIGFTDKPVSFQEMGNPENTVEAKLIIMMAIKDPKQQVDTLSHIAGLLKSQEAQERILNAKQPSDIVDIFNSKTGV